MSRFTDNDGDDEFWMLDQGRWQHNYRQALKGKRGRQALRDLREALLALPEKRLIEGAVCTVGGLDGRAPAMADEEFARRLAEHEAAWTASGRYLSPDYPRKAAEIDREEREEDREKLAGVIERQGEGVCLIGAYLWHKNVKAGMDPGEAFAAVPAVFGETGDGDPLWETAGLAAKAGLARTLAWELAYKNDETFGNMTPEQRYTASLAWIDAELGETAEAAP
jgi:hypothetical protein